jgi:hypothetical protein
MKRKVNDFELLEFLKQDKTQKQAAQHFKVSPAYICKKLKRLLPQPFDALDKYNLTDQQKNFVIEKTKGATNTQAALCSYEVSSIQSAKVIGSQLMAKPEIKMALSELLELHIPQQHKVRRLRSHVDHHDPVVSLKALDMSWKLDGSYAPEKHISVFSVRDAVEQLDAELMKTAEAMRQIEAELEAEENQ